MRDPQFHARYSISDIDFEALPPTLRRKYFSSLERLRLARDGSCLSPDTCPKRFSRSNVSARTRSKSASNELNLRLCITRAACKNRLQKRRSAGRHSLVNPATAEVFASLPPALQRKQFSPEERILYANERQSVIFDAADEALYWRRWEDSHCQERPLSGLEDCDLKYLDSLDEDPADSAVDMASYSLDSFRWLEDEEELDLRLDDYHAAIAETAQRQAAQARWQSRRTLSFSSLSRHRSSGSSTRVPSRLSRSATPSMQFKTNRPSSMSSQHPRSRLSTSSIGQQAAHYQDPAARMKLRVYLASPQKFDEAIEFGFPSLQEKDKASQIRPQTSPGAPDKVGLTFFTDDTPSLSGDEGDDRDEIEGTDPKTPEEAVFRMHRSSQQVRPSAERAVVARPLLSRDKTEPYALGTTTDREMTLRMTLTRPDLRLLDETNQQKRFNVNTVPLEHAELTCVENPLSVWDTLPVEESKVKKLLRKLKFK